MYLIFDTETTGLPKDFKAPITDTSNWPRCVQIAWQLHDEMGTMLESNAILVQPDGFDIPYDAERIHGISTTLAKEEGVSLENALQLFVEVLAKSRFVVGQNIQFDLNVVGCELVRLGVETNLASLPVLDTCTENSASLLQLPGGRGGKFKLPTLTELHTYLFGNGFGEAHNASADVEATTRCFFELLRKDFYSPEELLQDKLYIEKFKNFNPTPFEAAGLEHLNLKERSKFIKKRDTPAHTGVGIDVNAMRERLADAPFAHLHNHTQFSVLQSTITINQLVEAAAKDNQKAVALTDMGNMMAAFKFEAAVAKYNKALKAERELAEEEGAVFTKNEIIPIIGCTFNICKDHQDKRLKDNGNQLVLLAKNKNGYQNLIKLSSYAFTQGMYYVPRIDKVLLEQYKEDLIVLSGNMYGEIASLILNVGEIQAEETLLWYKNLFGDDFYLEIMRHDEQENEERANETILNFAQKHNVKLLATNSTFYATKEDSISHDILLCVKDAEQIATPIGRGRGFRYGLENQEYYFKSSEEMKELFLDVPEAIENIDEVINKIEHYPLAREVLLPAFDIPDEFLHAEDNDDGGKRGENAFLRHLTYEGAKIRYPDLTPEIIERIDFELATVERTGYPGYFLIVQDFIAEARKMGVAVGPGRGSAAGSAVAYCTGITNIDPIKYDLLFERFLNPDRISMPDIDIDFDDEGRQLVIDYVINKYGANQVAQIITYGTMAAKSSIRDTARVLDLPLFEAVRLSNLVPNWTLQKLLRASDEDVQERFKTSQDDLAKGLELRKISKGTDLAAQVVQRAAQLEGSVRNVGIHACGVIITPSDITNFVPVALAKDSEMFCTQYDNSVAEYAGLLKMDFLGLKTLTLIKDAVRIVKERTGIQLDPEEFPIDDVATYELFQRGDTVGIFQYESPGMQKYMKDLKPTVFADLIAMNALYRPGPIEYIPSFIKRKHGDEEIVYDVADCEEYLKETYGITVYQEQVMLLSQKLAGFTKGEADNLRKAMGKKLRDVLDKMRPDFLKRAQEKGHALIPLEKIWKDWEAFASYAFNKSHSTCYAWVAYQTAYLKANYPAEYMASVLSNNMNDIKQVSFFMTECNRMGIPVLGPDVNESSSKFTVNKEGGIRFGMAAIKGVGGNAVEDIIIKRQEAPYTTFFDFVKRINLRQCNKKVMESLAYAGGFDCFTNIHRAQFFYQEQGKPTFLETAMRFGASFQDGENSAQFSLFGEGSEVEAPEPKMPECSEYTSMFKLAKEKEVVGIFISGHPMEDYSLEIESFCNANVSMIDDVESNKSKTMAIACVVSEAEHAKTKNGDDYGRLTIEDSTGSKRLMMFQESYLKFKHFLEPNIMLVVRGMYKMRYRNSTVPEFEITSIEMLDQLRDKYVKSMTLKFDYKSIDLRLVEDLNGLFSQYPGNVDLSFDIKTQQEHENIRLKSRTMRFAPENELLKQLKKYDCEIIFS
jgi:DNA polymerase III subunit alpha